MLKVEMLCGNFNSIKTMCKSKRKHLSVSLFLKSYLVFSGQVIKNEKQLKSLILFGKPGCFTNMLVAIAVLVVGTQRQCLHRHSC